MKLLKIKIKGLKLFKDELEIDFFAEQRVGPEKNEMLYKLFSNIYINNVIALIGINASGKTSILKAISFVINMLNNEPINKIVYNDILNGINYDDEVIFETYFYSEENYINKLRTVVKKENKSQDSENKYIIKEEKLWRKSFSTVKTKKSLFEFEKLNPVQIRNSDEEFLMEDVSIIISLNKRYNSRFYIRDMINLTNTNQITFTGEFPPELITFLDPSIEYLNLKNDDKKLEIRLKFKEKEEIILYDPLELNNYLSSGTIKGINVFLNAMLTFNNGGYLIVDELENHFNREIVSTLIRFFMNEKVNNKGATIVFSTHYSQLLDEFERSDDIYIVRNKNGINVEKLSKILKRNDIKKSEAYQSGYLQGTAPVYESYINFKNAIISGRIDEV
ncbi:MULTISPECIES: AAA family ATPase [Clostridium]|uniref:AAA family ATPase n=1 Tax=Clostridium TaxID=1485 RepID=UPI0012E62324|nr:MULTISPECIES: AAA family ATPase [Clostridium]MBS4780997.1 AAA family ATPase [Clostridium sp.]CAG9704890.1 ATPase_AAA_core domain-containing protein [Clostridium neonatale]CAI3195919.1 ATPase_AAA_core domain-containing protein [Clostridium neonatale]CAI3204754.1 ATPase_AAA_core domain-containing protein [Clostridium neonatale]CAI3712309.1 ATPase_AAA_core domain-containing protein [Clostridium neonatale]